MGINEVDGLINWMQIPGLFPALAIDILIAYF
jgi:hypothetical protein